ncbi:unnamed protein product [Clonostachys rhizophaga]|uniref:tRNA synthetases class I catalytic domain-containing protein n=1 Tax=Clonostachys rhizophaga TaxID=160324 RepID=A0A9N9V7Y0_9HYPO|nr:unnamed protein product [Clonostachys rhizophaga]
MPSNILGSQSLSISVGGNGFAFPHRDDELAQHETFFHEHNKSEHTWVIYFIHLGDLPISGSKMARSYRLPTELDQAKKEFHDALLNSLGTPNTMLVVLQLVNATNVHPQESKDASIPEVEAIAR